MRLRPKLEQVITDETGAGVDMYLEDVSTKQFIDDVKALMAAYSDNGVIDIAVELLQSCRPPGGRR